MSDYDIHSCGYYCDRHACIVAQRNELRDKLFSDQAVKTYSGGKPNYTQPIEPTIDGWPLWSGLPQPEPEPVALDQIEQYRMQMVAIATAAIGYWKEGDGIQPEYDTPPLRDVAKLYSKYEALYTAPPQREWQGLTEGETVELALSAFALPEVSTEMRSHLQNELIKSMNEPDSRLMIFAAIIEQALQEKNT
jgi:hypothetical protein